EYRRIGYVKKGRREDTLRPRRSEGAARGSVDGLRLDVHVHGDADIADGVAEVAEGVDDAVAGFAELLPGRVAEFVELLTERFAPLLEIGDGFAGLLTGLGLEAVDLAVHLLELFVGGGAELFGVLRH